MSNERRKVKYEAIKQGWVSTGGSFITRFEQDFTAFASLGNLRYLSAMKYAIMLVGNSSSGLYETPSFGVPCVNIGDRQRGRLRAENVIDCDAESDAIADAIKQAQLDEFGIIARNAKNPFGDGHSAERIVEKIKFFLRKSRIDLKKTFFIID